MDSWATIPRVYPMSGEDYPSMEEPPAQMQQDGFKPTFIDPEGNLSPGDPVEYKYLNFIFNDLYGKAEALQNRLNTLEGK